MVHPSMLIEKKNSEPIEIRYGSARTGPKMTLHFS